MDWLLILALVTTLGSIGLMVFDVLRENNNRMKSVVGGFPIFLLGMTMLAQRVIPEGTVLMITQLTFVSGALWFLVLQFRARPRKQSNP